MSIVQFCSAVVRGSIGACRRVARSVERGQALYPGARVSRLSAAALAVALGVSAAPAAGQTSETFYEPYFTDFLSTSGAFGRRCDLNIGGPNNCVFWGGASPFSSAMEEYDISNFDARCGASTFSALAQIGGWQSQGDYAIVYFRFLDSNRNQTGLVQLGPVTPAERGNQTRLLWRSASGAVPANTRYVRLEMEMHRVSGTNNDGYIGDTEITINTPNIDTFDPENGAIRIRNVGGGVELTLGTHPGYTPPSVRWTSPSRGVLRDGAYPDGLFVSGATTQTLTLGNLQRIDSGSYQARTETAACFRTRSFAVDVGCVSGPLQVAGSAASSPPAVQQGWLEGLSVQGGSALAVVGEDQNGRVLNLSLFRRRTDAWGLPWWDLEAQQSVAGNAGGNFLVQVHGSSIAYPTNGPTGIETQLYGLTPQGTLGPLGTIQWPPAAPDSSGYYVYALGDGVIPASSGPNVAFASRGQNEWIVTETMRATDFVPEADFAAVLSIVGDKILLYVRDYDDPFASARWFGIIRHASGQWSTGMRYELDVYEPQIVSGGSTVEVIDVFRNDELWSLSSTGWVNEGRVLSPSWLNSIGGYPVRAPGSLLSWGWQSGIPHLFRRMRTPAGWSLIGINPFGTQSSSASSSWAAIDSQTAVFADRLPNRSVVFTAYHHTDPIARRLPEFIPESQTGDPGVTFIRYTTSSPDPARHTWRFRGQPITGPSLPAPFEHIAATPGSGSTGVSLRLTTNGTPITAADITLAVLDPCSNATFEYPCATSELEPNDFLDAPSIPLSSGQSIIGLSYGATADGSQFSRDYLGILATPATPAPASAPASQFSPGAPMITRHRFSVRAAEPTLGNPPRFSVDLRGHGASNGAVNRSTAIPIQTDVPPVPEIERIITTVQWYALGPDPARMDVRIAAKPDSPQGQYIGTLQSEPVQPAILPWSFSAGPMTFTTDIGATLTDTAMWLYDRDLRPIPGLGNDDTPTGPETGAPGATISTTLLPGRYFLALSLYPLSTPEPLPFVGTTVGGSVTATPNIAVSGSSLERTNITLRVQSSGRLVEFANAPGGSAPASIDFPCRFIDRNEIIWIEVNVGWPASGCAAADIADTDAGTVFTGSGPDNIIDNGDFTAFFTAFFTDPADPAHLVADIADTDAQYPPIGFRDGVVDNGDFTAFFASFFSGSCGN